MGGGGVIGGFILTVGMVEGGGVDWSWLVVSKWLIGILGFYTLHLESRSINFTPQRQDDSVRNLQSSWRWNEIRNSREHC